MCHESHKAKLDTALEVFDFLGKNDLAFPHFAAH